MNYLAHAWVLPELVPELVLGAALPDLLGALDRRGPRATLEGAERLAAEGAHELARGVRAHLVADACFHQLPAFTAGRAALAPLAAGLAQEGARVRGFFLTHLLLEMLLDAELLAREPDLGAAFYEALARADREAAARAAASALGAPRDPAAFARGAERFVQARFLLDYVDDEALAARLEQVLGRARQTLPRAARVRLVAGLPAARAEVRALLPALVERPRAAVARALAGVRGAC